MTFIDWSDPEMMFELLTEYIADEWSQSHGDPDRERFLSALLADLRDLGEQFTTVSPTESLERLQQIHRSQPSEFDADEVLSHVGDCIEELERTTRESSR